MTIMEKTKKDVKEKFNLTLHLASYDFDRKIFFCNVEDQDGNWEGLQLKFSDLKSMDFNKNIRHVIKNGITSMPFL